MRRIIRLSAIAACIMTAVSCASEIIKPVGPLPMADNDGRVDVSIDVSGISIDVSETKGSLLNNVESLHSGAVIYAYIVRNGVAQIDNYAVIGGDKVSAPGHSASGPVSMKLVSGAEYDFYVVGNSWYINKNTGEKVDWFTAMGSDLPADFDNGLKKTEYRFDGSDFRSIYRHERFSEVKTYGLPYSGYKKGVQINSTGQGVSVDNCRYLFAKVTFTVDHTGLDGGLNDGFFKNQKVFLKQANPSIRPFSETNVLSGTSINADYDENMSNGHCETYTLYVPENRHPNNLLETDDPALKSGDNELLEGIKNELTYIEFHGTVNPSNAYAAQIGYRGDVTYKFYLGSDNCKNFDIIGGKNYHVTMSFTVDNLFNPSPLWRVTMSNFSDSRLIDVMKDASCTQPLETTFVGVRANRGNSVYVYVNKEGSPAGTNAIIGKPLVADPSSFHAENVTDCAICMSPSASSLLSNYGISTEYKAETGALSFAVSNKTKFEALRAGAGEFDVTLTVLPSKDGQERERTFTVKALEDMAVVVPDTDMYIGQKVEIRAKGFLGTPKLSSSVGTVFRTTNVAGSGNYLSGTPVGFTGDKIDLYAYNYNTGGTFTLTLTSDDTFNDGSVSKTVSVKKPKLGIMKGEIHLGIDGTERDLEVGYYPETGIVPFNNNVFDSEVYAQVMEPVFSADAAITNYVGFDDLKAFLKKMPSDKTTSDRQFGKIYVKGKNAELFPGSVVGPAYIWAVYRYPSWISKFSDILGCDVFNIDTQEAADNRKVETTAQIDLAFCSSPFTSGNRDEWYELGVGDDFGSFSEGSDGMDNGSPHLYLVKSDTGESATVYWHVKPQVKDNNINSPWGSRTVTPIFINKHDTSQKYSLMPSYFVIKYAAIELNRLCAYPVYNDARKYMDANCFVCCNLAAVLYVPNAGKQLNSPATFMEMNNLPIGGKHYTNYDYSTPEDVRGGGSNTSIYLRYVAWSLRGWEHSPWGNYSSPNEPGYNGIYWTDEHGFTDEAIRTQAGVLTNCYFYYGTGGNSQTLKVNSYPESSSTMMSYIPITISNDPKTIRSIKY